MDPVLLVVSVMLVAAVLLLILYPFVLRTPAIPAADDEITTLAEYEVRYQAALAVVKDLMLDHEMGKVSTADYETLLHQAKMNAARIRRQMDRLDEPVDATIGETIETLITQTRATLPDAMLDDINAELAHLTTPRLPDTVYCPSCSQAIKASDAFCMWCGKSVTTTLTEPFKARVRTKSKETIAATKTQKDAKIAKF